jgi:hypothetical protein
MAEEHKTNFTDMAKVRKNHGNGLESDRGSIRDGIAVSSGGDRREGDVLELEFVSEGERFAIATRERLRFTMLAAMPHRADGVDDKPRGKLSSSRVNCTARRKRALLGNDFAALVEDLAARGTMDCAVDSAASHQGRVGGVDDGIDLLARDVALQQFDGRAFAKRETDGFSQRLTSGLKPPPANAHIC